MSLMIVAVFLHLYHRLTLSPVRRLTCCRHLNTLRIFRNLCLLISVVVQCRLAKIGKFNRQHKLVKLRYVFFMIFLSFFSFTLY